ncbi:MAG: hypothetical protein J6C20_00385 [Paludibacteraceae bacterium]|nr:hypothetical protein [Paludibacteraceae bacterium]
MSENLRKPELIVIAGPNGSGGCYKSIENCKVISSIVDRLYVYDNSVDGEDAKLQFRLVNGVMGKMYVTDVPEWAQAILPDAYDFQI